VPAPDHAPGWETATLPAQRDRNDAPAEHRFGTSVTHCKATKRMHSLMSLSTVAGTPGLGKWW